MDPCGDNRNYREPVRVSTIDNDSLTSACQVSSKPMNKIGMETKRNEFVNEELMRKHCQKLWKNLNTPCRLAQSCQEQS